MTQFPLHNIVIVRCLVLLLISAISFANKGKKSLILQEADLFELVNYRYLFSISMMIIKINTFDLAESNRHYPYAYWKTYSSSSLDYRIQKVLNQI